MHISEFDYELPEELIAQEPLEQRDASRMMVVDRANNSFFESKFAAFPDLISPGDTIVINNTRVFPARLIGQRHPSGGRVEFLLLREVNSTTWDALARPAQRLQQGAEVRFGDEKARATVTACAPGGIRRIEFISDQPVDELLEEVGQTPLPPYIKRPHGSSAGDRERYQTVFASRKGAVAAPTAGLHFTPEILQQLRDRGSNVVEITLHVGYGTFEPVREEDIDLHQVEAEFFSIDETAANVINQTRLNGGRIIAVGTTTTRALETASNEQGIVKPVTAETNLTIKPGYRFNCVDALLTNFHLPRSSLLVLVSAFAGRDLVLAAYKQAVQSKFRFYSYGDCMFVI